MSFFSGKPEGDDSKPFFFLRYYVCREIPLDLFPTVFFNGPARRISPPRAITLEHDVSLERDRERMSIPRPEKGKWQEG